MEGLLLPQHQRLFSILAEEEGGKLRRGISKGFASRLATTEPLEQEEGRERGWPEPTALPCPPCLRRQR